MSVLRQQAMQQSNAVVADKIQLKILQNALPKLINKINVLLKTQLRTGLINTEMVANLA